jgi:hypothetical protein
MGGQMLAKLSCSFSKKMVTKLMLSALLLLSLRSSSNCSELEVETKRKATAP